MTGGKGTVIAIGVVVLLSMAGSVSAVPTFPVCLRGTDIFPGRTDRPAFDVVLIDAPGRDRTNPTQEALPASAPHDQTVLLTSGDSIPLLTVARDTSNESNLSYRDTLCEIPSPGTLLLAALGAFLVGALRMRRML